MQVMRTEDKPSPAALWEPHHPTEPQAGLAGRAQGYIGRGHVRGRLEGLDLSRRLAGWAGAHDVHLTHAKAGMGVGISTMVRAGPQRRAHPRVWTGPPLLPHYL